MGKEKVIVQQRVIDKLNALVEILFEQDYFFIKGNAKDYVKSVYLFMYEIPKRPHRIARNKKNGKYFCTYKPNRNTSWYITFDMEDNVYLITNLTNNHSSDYTDFILGIK
jgi:chlorite dismutase